jgi:hypothetical protein
MLGRQYPCLISFLAVLCSPVMANNDEFPLHAAE